MKSAGGFGWRNILYIPLIFLLLSVIAFPCYAGEREGDDPTFSWGFAERVRQTNLLNAVDLMDRVDNDMNFIRVRTRLWAEWRPAGGIKFLIKLNNEHRHYLKPDRDFEIDEIVMENLCLRWDRVAGLPLDIVAGRQNFRYGEGFLYMDGGPLDGSRTDYFNAIRFIIPAGERSFEVHFLSDPAKDDYLPTINNRDRMLVESKETAAGIYYRERSLESVELDGYYFFKEEEKAELLHRPNSRIHTVGSRIVGELGRSISVTAEGALQLGEWGDSDRFGYGGYCYGSLRPPVRFEPGLTLGVLYLSGDDVHTDKYEGWNPLFGRWPKWSELYIYTLLNEHGIAYWNNLFAPQGKLSLQLHERLGVECSLHAMYAPESDLCIREGDRVWFCPDRISRTGNYRGTLTGLKFNWRINKYLTGHLLWEHLDPGDFYKPRFRDSADFIRWELYYKF